MNKKLSLFKRDWHIVEQWKYYFLISGFIIILGIVLLCIPKIGLNLGIDFEGGYALQVNYSSGELTKDNYKEQLNKIEKIVNSVKNQEGETLKIARAQMQGEAESTSILIRFKELDSGSENTVKLIDDLKTALINPDNGLASEENPFAIKIGDAATTAATIKTEYLVNGILALLLSSVLMLVYIAFRFEFISGLAAIIALLHDGLVMIAFMVFTRMEVNSTFIAALITIFGYSINNTIVIFDRVRDNLKTNTDINKTAFELANESIRDTFWRSFNTLITTLFTIVVLTAISVPAVREFSVPIIVGLLAGGYSSMCIATSIWALWHRSGERKGKKFEVKQEVEKQTEAQSAVAE